MSKEALAKVKKELKKLKMMSPMSRRGDRRAQLHRLDPRRCPGTRRPRTSCDIVEAERILDEDHYGLKKVKERILEYLAVQALVKKLKGPILCLVGPPGVGKTSLAQSIARATGRKFVRLSLGGVRDEAEIRGHRRTYIGALPGKIIQSLKKAGTQQPGLPARRDRQDVDRLPRRSVGGAARGARPGAEPRRSTITTSTSTTTCRTSCSSRRRTTCTGIPLPLQDRMEIIQLPGYTEFEKLNIAEHYLVPQAEAATTASRTSTSSFTEDARPRRHPPLHEGGGRPHLEREIATVCRKVARDVVAKKAPCERQRRHRVGGDHAQAAAALPRPARASATARQEGEDEIGLVNGPGRDRSTAATCSPPRSRSCRARASW